MSGENEKNLDPANLDPAEPCGSCGCGCRCGCAGCLCRLDHIADVSNRDHYAGEGGPADDQVVPTLPISIATMANRFAALDVVDASFDDNIIGPNDAPPPGASLALTLDNVNQFTASWGHTSSYWVEWLRQHRRDVDEDPYPYFIQRPVEPETLEEQQMIWPMELDDSVRVEDNTADDTRSTISQMTCSRSHSSRASTVLAGIGPNPNFISHPLPLLEERNCPNCGHEHD